MAEQVKDRPVFQFPDRVTEKNESRKTHDRGLLLWRVLLLEEEVRSGVVRLMKQPFMKVYMEHPERYIENGPRMVRDIASLIQSAGRHHLQSLSGFSIRVTARYVKELRLMNDRAHSFSFDILHQIFQLIGAKRTLREAEQVILDMGTHQEKTSISSVDRDMLVQKFRAFVFLSRKIVSSRTLREAVEKRDEFIVEASLANQQVTLTCLDSIFRFCVAQILLSRKYRCDTLIVEWLREYSLDPEHMVRVAKYIPYDTSFLAFRSQYKSGIIALKTEQTAGSGDSDTQLLRSLGIFYTSWVSKVSELIA